MAERKKPTPKKTAAQRPATVRKAVTPPAPKPTEPVSTVVEVCPRCGTTKFGPEERTRIDGRRTVRFTVLVCERGHTFARPVAR